MVNNLFCVPALTYFLCLPIHSVIYIILFSLLALLVFYPSVILSLLRSPPPVSFDLTIILLSFHNLSQLCVMSWTWLTDSGVSIHIRVPPHFVPYLVLLFAALASGHMLKEGKGNYPVFLLPQSCLSKCLPRLGPNPSLLTILFPWDTCQVSSFALFTHFIVFLGIILLKVLISIKTKAEININYSKIEEEGKQNNE